MRVFVTGATGFIGSAVVKELLAAGHKVLGLSRSDEGAQALETAGAEVHRGSTADLEGLKKAVAQADGVIHLAFNHDFSKFKENCEDDRRVIETLSGALAGSKRPFIVTSGTAMASIVPGQLATEDGATISSDVVPRAASEEAARAADKLSNVSIVRLPQVHDTAKQGLVTYAIMMFRQKGVCAYIAEGSNRWPAAHVIDVARLYRLALEKAAPGAIYHAVAEQGVSMREIVEAVGPRLGLPVKSITREEAEAFFGWLAMFAVHDMPASAEKTQKLLHWQPTGPGILADLRQLQVAAM